MFFIYHFNEVVRVCYKESKKSLDPGSSKEDRRTNIHVTENFISRKTNGSFNNCYFVIEVFNFSCDSSLIGFDHIYSFEDGFSYDAQVSIYVLEPTVAQKITYIYYFLI